MTETNDEERSPSPIRRIEAKVNPSEILLFNRVQRYSDDTENSFTKEMKELKVNLSFEGP